MRYIDADKLLEYYEERHKNLCLKNGETDAYCQGYEDAMYAAEHLDFAADVVPRSEVAVEAVQMVALEEANRGLRIQLEIAKSEVERLQAEIERLTINMNAYGLAAKRLAEEKGDVEHTLSDLKKEIHDKAVYPEARSVKPYISLKVVDAIIINKMEEIKNEK